MNDLVVSLDSVLVVGTLDGLVHALNFSSGETIWSFNSGGRLVTSSTLLGAQPSLAHPVVVSGLDGTIFVFGEEEPLQLEHTIQELVASPTLYSERGVAVGSKSVRVAALDSLTGEPRYFYATPTTRADPLLAEDALPHEGGSSREPAGNASAPDGLLIVSRSDYHVEVRDGASGARRWAISLGEYTLALSPAAGHSHARAQEAPLRMRLTLIDHELCAATAGSSACTWSHAFSSPPVLLFHLDRASGAQEQLQFLTAAPLRAAHLSRPASVPAEAALAIAIAPQPKGASGVEAAGQLGERGEQRLAVSVQAGVAREAPPTRYRHPLLPLLPLLAQSLPPRAQVPPRHCRRAGASAQPLSRRHAHSSALSVSRSRPPNRVPACCMTWLGWRSRQARRREEPAARCSRAARRLRGRTQSRPGARRRPRSSVGSPPRSSRRRRRSSCRRSRDASLRRLRGMRG